MFTLFLEEIGRTNSASFPGVCKNDNPIVEDSVQMNTFLYDVDFVDEAMIGELSRSSFGKHFNNFRLLPYSSHNCYVSNINAFLKTYGCPSCDHFINNAKNLESHLTTCKEGVKHAFPKMVYHFCETLFDKIDSFGIFYTDNQKLFNNVAIWDFESISVDNENFRHTETTTWIGKHIRISVPISSNLMQEPIFVCDPNPRDWVLSFTDALATQNKTQIKMNFLRIETATRSWLAGIVETLSQRRSHCVVIEAEDDNSENSSTQFLQMQPNQIFDVRDYFERYCNTLPDLDSTVRGMLWTLSRVTYNLFS